MAGRRTFFFDGLGVSGGVSIGPAYVIEDLGLDTNTYEIIEHDVEPEVARFSAAVGLAKDEVQAIKKQVEEKIDHQQAAIFDAHLMILEDPILVDRTIERIRKDRQNAESVFWSVTKSLGEMMSSLGDDYFAERNHDLYDVARRVIKFLAQGGAPARQAMPREGCVIIARELGPAETAQFTREHVLAFCTDEGGPTSHTAIMAKALGLPAIVGLEYVTHYIRNGDPVIVDGTEGKLILNPSRQLVAHYERKAVAHRNMRMALGELRDLPAQTTDGTVIKLLANLEFPNELEMLPDSGAEGVGLFRTEFLFLDRPTMPTEEEQAKAYSAVIDGAEGQPVILRTLDIGGDKLPLEEYHTPEANPFLGLRAIRLGLKRPELLRVQMRAMLAAAEGRELRVMIPMVSSLEEVRAARKLLMDLLHSRTANGGKAPSDIKVGAMIEIPSAALMAGELADEVDFLSIGTNDLVQYTLAVDRVNKSVAHLYKPAHPAVLRLVKMVADAGDERHVPVSVCGEMASDPMLALLLVGLGIRSLSMSPLSVALVKRAIRSASLADLESLAHDVLSCGTVAEVDDTLQKRLASVINNPDPSPSGRVG